MKRIKKLVIAGVFFLFFIPLCKGAEDILNKRLEDCAALFDEIMQMPDRSIPKDLLSKCSGIAIFPGVLKGGFIIGGRYGKGVVLYHNKKTGEWSAPAFYTIKGLSYGFQIGGQAIDLILVITTDRGMESFLKNNISLGGDIGVAAGPVGRNAAADTDLRLKANIFSYSRSKGLFAGISLKGAVIKPERKSNKQYYKTEDITVEDILYKNKVKPTSTAKKLIKILKKYSQ